MRERRCADLTYSPLRYPGGKSKLAPLIFLMIQNCPNDCHTYIEPFAGGAGIALTLLLENNVERIVINDFDKAIYSFWRAVKEDAGRLIELIRKTPISVDEWKHQKLIYTQYNNKYSLELGFAAFYLNRTNRSGVLKGGPIGGLDQSGNYLIDARFNKDELIDRIEKIFKRKKDIFIYNQEVRAFIMRTVPQYQNDAFIYFDPPYYNKGKELYKNFFNPQDHALIADSIRKNVLCDWVVTYDDVPQIEMLYKDYPQQKIRLRYSVARSSPAGNEILVLKDSCYRPTAQQLSESKIKIQFL
jgi:DNA adenine methylase